MRACTNSWKNQCSRNFGKFIKQSDPIRICRNDPAETTHGRRPMFNECATSAFQRQGSDQYMVIATTSCDRTNSGFFDLKHCYQRASADNISRKFGPRSGPTKSSKLIKPDGFPDFFYHTFESTCKTKAPMGLRGRSGWSLLLTKSGFSRL